MGETDEKRSNRRVQLQAASMHGKLYNVVQFKVKDLSWGGINFLSNFQAQVGRVYTILLFHDGQQHEFEIEVLRSEVDSILSKPTDIFSPGILLSVAARFVRLDAERKSFLRQFLEHGNGSGEVGGFSSVEPVGGK